LPIPISARAADICCCRAKLKPELEETMVRQHQATFSFCGRLEPLAAKAKQRSYRFNGQPAIKDAIEAQGVPHTEVDLIVVNHHRVAFDYLLQNADVVEVFPYQTGSQQDRGQGLSPPHPEPLAFILDVHLGKLARRLRMLGFDCRYRNDYADPEIIATALQESLIILTRDRGILKHACVRHGYLVTSQQVDQQVKEVLQRYQLFSRIRALKRCPGCNGLLQVVDKELIRDRLQPKTARYYQHFLLCADCQQLYWQGSHYAQINRWLSALKEQNDDAG
jgi:uncharacterized protein with PIN domain